MPVRNGAHFLPTILETVFSSVEQNDEVIIIDDGSNDGTNKILTSWIKRFPQLRFISTPGLGLVSALNLGLAESTNKWIARYDVDDKYPINRLSKQRRFISNDIGAVFCDYSIWSEKIKNVGVLPNAVQKSAVSISLSNSQRTPHPGVLFNREKVISVGSYQEDDFPAEDLSLWLRLSRISDLVGVPEVLLNYRISRTSISGTKRNLALKKSHEVRKLYPINPADIQYCEENFEELCQIYDKYSYKSERKILLILDLIKAHQLNGTNVNLPRKFVRDLLLDLSTYKAGFGLVKTKLLKKII